MKDLKDIHVSGLSYVTEAAEPSSKYKRISIPYMENRHCLGYIEGPAASISKRTRNDHMYNLKLWRNVESSSDFQEGMNCATIIGELDHPEERVDYSLTKGAVVLTDWEIREDEEVVWARFAILDNDEGRTLLSYVKFGTKLGVSSRGLGDEIMDSNGETIIDPDSYEFYCFDVVAFPAASVARQTYKDEIAEAVSVHAAFSDKVKTEIESCQSVDDLNALKVVIESTNVSDKSQLVESISHKLSRLSESADEQGVAREEKEDDKQILLSSDESENDANDLLERSQKNATFFKKAMQEKQEEIEHLEDAISEGLNSIDELSEELTAVNNKLTAAAEENKDLTTTVEGYSRKVSSLNRNLSKMSVENCTLKRQLDSRTRQLEGSSNALKKSKRSLQEFKMRANASKQNLVESQKFAETINQSLTEKISQLESSIDIKDQQIVKLRESAQKLEKELQEARSQISSKSRVVEGLQRDSKHSLEKSTALLEAYVEKSCKAENVSKEDICNMLPLNYTKSDVDRVVKEAARVQRHMEEITWSPNNMSKGLVVEHNTSNYEGKSSFLERALKNK